jgi:iron complex outermembrane receptor protein
LDISGAKPSFTAFDPNEATDVPGLRPSVTNTIEGGYKGQYGDHFRVALDLYYEWRRDFVGPPQVITPMVFLDPTSLAAYLAKYMPQTDATRIATQIGGASGSQTNIGLPLGTIAPTGEYGGSSDVLVTYRNFGALHRVGSDVGAQWAVTDVVTLTGAYSWTNKTLWRSSELGGLSDLALNAPGNRASLAVQRRDASRGYSVYARVRYVGAFPMNSGVYVGNVAAYTLADAGFAYRVPQRPDLLLTLTADNVFDTLHREFIGAPQIGRLVMAQLQYTIR